MKSITKTTWILILSMFLSAERNLNAQNTATFNYISNATQTWTVPTCVSHVTVQLWGAGGAAGQQNGYSDAWCGGSGAYMEGVLSGLSGGQTLTLYVPHGGNYYTSNPYALGGWPGGGNAGADVTYVEYGGAGGGYAAVAVSGTYYAVAGAGGGGGSTGYGGTAYGGAGGNPNSVLVTGTEGANGGPGLLSSGGAGGAPYSVAGSPGTALTGGEGQPQFANGEYGGGGGGGGWYGGGGGGDHGNAGGGGSSFPGSTFNSGGLTFTIITNLAGTTNSATSGSAIAPGSPPAGIGSGNIAAAGGNGYITIKWNIDSVESVSGNIINNVSCNGGGNGIASAAIIGGPVSAFTYSWAPTGQTTDTATELTAGTYTITASGSCGLSKTATVTITQPNILAVPGNVISNVSCYQSNNGIAASGLSGGTAPYEYSWAPGGGTNDTATGLSAGMYRVVVEDNNGCLASTTVTITQPNVLSLATNVVSNVVCGIRGSVTSSVGGGTAPYTYSWTGGSTDSSISVSSGGTYMLKLTDNNGCSVSSSVNISETPAVFISATTTSGIACNGDNGGSASSIVDGGKAPYAYLWSNGGTYYNAVELSAGTYIVNVTDANGCSNSAATTVTEPAPLIVATDSTVDNGGCSGSAWVIVSGGVSPYAYKWSNGNTEDYDHGLCKGAYCCAITDANGCAKYVCIHVESTTGIDNITDDAGQIRLYPNPNNGQFTIESASASQSIVKIYNVLGEQIYSTRLNATNGGSNTINIGNQPNGVYLYRVTTETGTLLGDGKIVIQK